MLERYLEEEAVLDMMTAFLQGGLFVLGASYFLPVLATTRHKRAAMFARIPT